MWVHIDVVEAMEVMPALTHHEIYNRRRQVEGETTYFSGERSEWYDGSIGGLPGGRRYSLAGTHLSR